MRGNSSTSEEHPFAMSHGPHSFELSYQILSDVAFVSFRYSQHAVCAHFPASMLLLSPGARVAR